MVSPELKGYPEYGTMRIVKYISTPVFLLSIILIPAPAPAGAAVPGGDLPGGFVVCAGCRDADRIAALAEGGRRRVLGLAADADAIPDLRREVFAKGLYGRVSVDVFDGRNLPLVDGSVNLLVIETGCRIPEPEVMRVLVPGGIARARVSGGWKKIEKPRDDARDDWTHYLYDATGNAVSRDRLVESIGHYQWIGGPKWARHHDHVSSFNALVSSGGRIFYVLDYGSRASILLPARWKLVAREAHNGVILWTQDLPARVNHLYRLKLGPFTLPRNLVAAGGRVYCPAGKGHAPVAFDAATGTAVARWPAAENCEEIILAGDTLLVIRNPDPDYRRGRNDRDLAPHKKSVAALDPGGGKIRWEKTFAWIAPVSLCSDGTAAFLYTGTHLVSLNLETGGERWRSKKLPFSSPMLTSSPPTTLVADGVLLVNHRIAKRRRNPEQQAMAAIDAETGKILWEAEALRSRYRSPDNIFVIDGTVWTAALMNPDDSGLFVGRDIRTGAVTKRFMPDIAPTTWKWFHHRCHRAKATTRFFLTSRTGIEFVDPATGHWERNNWVRGACLYGIMPANGLVYAPQHPCACFMESKLSGLSALASRDASRLPPPDVDDGNRLRKGPAFGEPPGLDPIPADWPTYRGDNTRSGHTETAVSPNVKRVWRTAVGDTLTPPTIAGNRLYTAAPEKHTVFALDTGDGDIAWRFTAGGPVDSPPTVAGGRVYFGCRDGRVYCLLADDGKPAWVFRAAPVDRRLFSFEKLESVWPVHGSVLLRDGVVYCAAGRSMFLDGGLRFLRLDARTGRKLSENVMTETIPENLRTPPENESILGWRVHRNADLSLEKDTLKIAVTGRDPILNPPQIGHAGPMTVRFRYRADAAGAAQVFYADTKGDFRENRTDVKIAHDNQWHEVSVDLPAKGKIKRWRFDPCGDTRKPDEPATVHLAWFRIEDARGNTIGAWDFSRAAGQEADLPATIQEKQTGFTQMPPALPDILSCDEDYVYMRTQKLDFAGRRVAVEPMAKYADQSGAGAHLFCPSGFLDDSWFHRTYQVWGKHFMSGAGGYYRAGRYTPSGRLLVFDEQHVYGYGRRQSYYRWSTPLEYELFKADKAPAIEKVERKKRGHPVTWAPDRKFARRWRRDLPLLVRAMVLAGDRLFVAGPPDLIDEEAADRHYGTPEITKAALAQERALDGEQGGILWAVSPANGKKQRAYDLDSPPVFDGMAAAGGRLYLVTMDGGVVCFGQ